MTATTAPTFATSPTWKLIAERVPANVAGTSIEVLSVSISKRLSPACTGSPAFLNHWVILPSRTVSPSWGIRTSISCSSATTRRTRIGFREIPSFPRVRLRGRSALPPTGFRTLIRSRASASERTSDDLGDPRDVREHHIFQDVCRRQRHVRGRDPYRRTVEIVEGLVGDDRHDLRSPSAQTWILLHCEQPIGLRDRPEDRPRVQRNKRADVDNLAVNAVLGLELVGRLERPRYHQSERADGRVVARPHDLGRAEGVDDLAVGHLALGGVERFVLEEDDGIGIADGRGEQPDDVARVRRRHHLQARNHHAPVLDALAVLCAEAGTRAVAGTDDERALSLSVGHVPALRKFIG